MIQVGRKVLLMPYVWEGTGLLYSPARREDVVSVGGALDFSDEVVEALDGEGRDIDAAAGPVQFGHRAV